MADRIDIEEAIYAVKELKKRSLHTDSFMIHHSWLRTFELLKELGFTKVSITQRR